jgi:hypothetical protein
MRNFLSKLQESGEIPFNLFEQQNSVEFLLPFLELLRNEIPGVTNFSYEILQATIQSFNPHDNFKDIGTDSMIVIPLEIHKSRPLTESLTEFCKESYMRGDNQ